MKKSEKVKHVLSEAKKGQVRDHCCHWPGCGKQVPPALWGCTTHWFTLPKYLRDKIWAAYRPGQEITMSPSKAYIAAAEEVEEWIAQHLKTKKKRAKKK